MCQRGGPCQAKFADQAVLAGAPETFDSALGLGRIGGDLLNAEFFESASEMGWSLLTGELFGDSPMGIVALEDAVAITIEAERHAVSGNHGAQGEQIADGVFGFELEVSREDLFGGVVLKTDQGELRTAAFEPVVRTGVGERHHAETWAGQASRTVLAGPAFLGRGQLGAAQDSADGLATDRKVLVGVELLTEMRIIEAQIFGAGQVQDQHLLGNRKSPRHGASAIAMLDPGNGIGLISPLEPLHLPFTQLQQTGGFAYAQPPARCILNHFHPLELFLTHRHHPERVTKSRCS